MRTNSRFDMLASVFFCKFSAYWSLSDNRGPWSCNQRIPIPRPTLIHILGRLHLLLPHWFSRHRIPLLQALRMALRSPVFLFCLERPACLLLSPVHLLHLLHNRCTQCSLELELASTSQIHAMHSPLLLLQHLHLLPLFHLCPHLCALHYVIHIGTLPWRANSVLSRPIALGALLIARPVHILYLAKWVFTHKLKSDGTLDRYKARWVVRGFTQRASVDFGEKFTPIVKPATIRIVLNIAASRQWPALMPPIQCLPSWQSAGACSLSAAHGVCGSSTPKCCLSP